MSQPLFTKRHFEVLARIIGDQQRKHELPWIPADWARQLQAYNPNFDTDRFLKACKS